MAATARRPCRRPSNRAPRGGSSTASPRRLPWHDALVAERLRVATDLVADVRGGEHVAVDEDGRPITVAFERRNQQVGQEHRPVQIVHRCSAFCACFGDALLAREHRPRLERLLDAEVGERQSGQPRHSVGHVVEAQVVAVAVVEEAGTDEADHGHLVELERAVPLAVLRPDAGALLPRAMSSSTDGVPGDVVERAGHRHNTSAQPMSASGSPTRRHLPVEDRGDLPSTKAKFPGLASPCTSVIVGHCSGRRSRSTCSSRSSPGAGRVARAGPRRPSGRARLRDGPWPSAIASRPEARRSTEWMAAIWSTMSSHIRRTAVRVVEQILRDDALVDRSREPLHHVEVAVEHVAGALVPPRARRPDGCGLQRAQDLELTLEVVRREQARLGRADPDDDVLAVIAVAVAPGDGEQQRLRAVAELDAIEAVDAHVLRVGELRREPRRQPALDVVVVASARREADAGSGRRRGRTWRARSAARRGRPAPSRGSAAAAPRTSPGSRAGPACAPRQKCVPKPNATWRLSGRVDVEHGRGRRTRAGRGSPPRTAAGPRHPRGAAGRAARGPR